MATIRFERRLTRYELDKKCLLLADDAGTDYAEHIDNHALRVKAGGKVYLAEVSDYYVDQKFQGGLHFNEAANPSDFFFDQSVSGGKRLRLTLDPAEREEGVQVAHLEVFVVTG